MSDKPDAGKDAEDLASQLFVEAAERAYVSAQSGGPSRPKRFYKDASVAPLDGGFAVLLDGRPINTPAKRRVVAPSRRLAMALAGEWAGQGETLDPSSMPLTKLVNSAIDGVALQMAEVEADLVRYAGSDLLCYRAGEPESLVAAQTAGWDPLLAFARDRLGARLVLAEGVMYSAQPAEAVDALGRSVRGLVGEGPGAPFRLAALHVMATLTGSLVIAIAKALNEIDLAAAWSAAHIDEDFQMRAWGEDAEALARREARFREMAAAAFLWDCTADPAAQ